MALGVVFWFTDTDNERVVAGIIIVEQQEEVLGFDVPGTGFTTRGGSSFSPQAPSSGNAMSNDIRAITTATFLHSLFCINAPPCYL